MSTLRGGVEAHGSRGERPAGRRGGTRAWLPALVLLLASASSVAAGAAGASVARVAGSGASTGASGITARDGNPGAGNEGNTKCVGNADNTPAGGNANTPFDRHAHDGGGDSDGPGGEGDGDGDDGGSSCASFSVVKSASAPSVVGGLQQITYSISADNVGSVSGAITVSDVVPTGTTYVSSSPAASLSGSTLTWSGVSVSAGQTTVFQFTVDVNAGVSSVANTATWSGPGCATTTCATNTVTTPTTDTVTLEGNGGTFGGLTATTATCPIGGVLTLGALPTPTQAGDTLTGWSTSPGGPAIGTATIPCATMTLYAQWSADQVTVTYNPNGGTVSPTSAVYTVGGSPLMLPTPSYPGNTFNGWFSAPSGGLFVGLGGASYQPTGPVTLYAQWTRTGGGSLLTPNVEITNLPSAPREGTSFHPTYATDGNGTVFSSVSLTPEVCAVSGDTVTFVGVGSCELQSTVAATTTYTTATGTQATQATRAVAAGVRTFPLTLVQVGVGGVHSSVASLHLAGPGSIAHRLKTQTHVRFLATPRPGFITTWSGACGGHALTCAVTVRNAEQVRVAFRPAVTLPVFYFATNMSNITMSASNVAQLKKDLVTLYGLKVRVLTIRAYADYRNGPSYNLALSQRRANSVTAFIRSLFPQVGLPAMRFVNLGLGILRASSNLQLDRKAVVTYI